MNIIIKGRWDLRLTRLVERSQLCLLSNQIAGFFYHQYLLKESTDVLVFLHGVIHQGKVASATTTFVWVWPVVPFIQSDCRILRLQDSGRNQLLS